MDSLRQKRWADIKMGSGRAGRHMQNGASFIKCWGLCGKVALCTSRIFVMVVELPLATFLVVVDF